MSETAKTIYDLLPREKIEVAKFSKEELYAIHRIYGIEIPDWLVAQLGPNFQLHDALVRRLRAKAAMKLK